MSPSLVLMDYETAAVWKSRAERFPGLRTWMIQNFRASLQAIGSMGLTLPLATATDGQLAMTRGSIVRPWAAALLIAVTAAAASAGGSGKTLTRVDDPVVLTASRLGALPDRQTRDLRLIRVEHGQPVPIPFQFDQCDRRAEVVVDGPAEFTLGNDDELVFMAKDAGDRADRDIWPPACDAVVEIALADPLRDERGWTYLLHCPGAPPLPALTPSVTYDRAHDEARSPFYQVDYARTHNYFIGMRIGDGSGALSPNLLRQTRMRGSPTFSMFFASVTLSFTERNSIVVVDGVKNGPVRAVRRARLSVDLGPLFPDLPNGTACTYHYPRSIVTPTRFGVPALALRLLRDFRFESVVDFDPRAMPMRYWDAANPAGVALDGPPDAALVTAVDHSWWVHSSAAGAVLHALLIPNRWREWGIVRGSVVHDGAAGYSLLHMIRLREGGDYDLLQAAIVLPDAYRPGDEAQPMAVLETPLQAEVRRLR
jgi:hypothetical protein